MKTFAPREIHHTPSIVPVSPAELPRPADPTFPPSAALGRLVTETQDEQQTIERHRLEELRRWQVLANRD